MSDAIKAAMSGLSLSLDAQYRTISIEAQGSTDSLQSALSRLPSFFKDVNDKLSQVFQSSIDAFWKPKDLSWAAGVLQKHNYMDLRETELPALPSLRSDYLTYTRALAKDAELSRTVLRQYIEPLAKAVAVYLGDKDGLRQRHPVETLHHFDLKPFSAQLRVTSRLLDPTRAMAMQPYGRLIRRQNDWSEVLKHIDDISRIFAEADHASFSYSVERVNDLLGKLLRRVTEEPEAYKVSGPTLDVLTKAAYVTATAVEFYGLTYKRAMALEEAMEHLVEAVKAI
jgi:hypothetical protein